jgi:hypothetical protein
MMVPENVPHGSLQKIFKKSAQVACTVKISIAHLSHENITTVDTGPSHPAVSGQAFFCHIANKLICLVISDGAAPAANFSSRNPRSLIIPSPA